MKHPILRSAVCLSAAMFIMGCTTTSQSAPETARRSAGPSQNEPVEYYSGNRYLRDPEIVGLYEVRGSGEELPEYQAYVTFEYDPEREHVEYYVNAKPVGKDQTGFDRVLADLRALPVGSTVILYPHLGSRYTFVRNYPFDKDWRLLDDIVRGRKLRFILSAAEPELQK